MIQMENVTKQYANGVTAIKDLNLKIQDGEFVYVIGPSGAGKSTFVKMLYHELKPSSGSIKIDDFDFSTMKPSQVPFLRRHIGIVFQDFKLLPRLTVYENVAYAMQVIEAPDDKIKDRVLEVLGLVGLEQKLRRFPDELSGGEQQRVALARALVNRPNILLADEPTGNLDPKNSLEIMKLLEEINERGTTVLVVTHNREIVNSFRKRVITMRKGVIVSDEEEGGYLED